MGSSGARWWRMLLRPRVFLPVVLTAALLAFALGITDAGQVMGRIRRLTPATLLVCLGLAGGYLLVKALQFHLLLGRLNIRVDWRALLLAFSIGEMTLMVPSGIYVQNYVLRRVRGAGFAHSSAATTVMLAVEATVVVLALLLFGVPGWYWLRPVLLAACLGGAVLLVLVSRRSGSPLLARMRRGRLRPLADALMHFLGGVRALNRPAVLMPSLLLAVVYLGALVGVYLLVARDVGVGGLTFVEASSIYGFSLAVTLLLGGVLTQLGVVEVAGLGAAHAWGYGLTESLAMLLGFRIVWMAAVWSICVPVAWLLRKEFQRLPGHRPDEPAH